MVTVKDVFDRAMHLSDNGQENSLETMISDNEEYRYRTLSILNILMGELSLYSDTYEAETGKRPKITPLVDINFTEEIPLDDYCAGTVMPYGLAANLFVDENPNFASFAEQRYEELLYNLKNGLGKAAGSEAITDIYGPGYYDENGNFISTAGDSFGFNWIARWG